MAQNDKNIINLLKKFPDQNPNPVLRFSNKGVLEYYNSPSKKIIQFFDLEMSEKVNNKDILNELNKAVSKKIHSFEIKVQSLTYKLKCVYIKELGSINVYGTDITAKKVIDKFPDSNPNPVMRVSYDGVLNYHNKASLKLVGGLSLKVSEIVSKPILKYIGEVSISGEATNYEIKVGNFTYSASFVPVPEFQFIIVYASDITALKVIKKFPNQNPNPVLRINLEGCLDYFNDASKYIVKNLGCTIGSKLPLNLLEKIFNEEDAFEREIGSKTYMFNVVKIEEFSFYLIYGTDTTDSKDKERILEKLSKYFSPQVYDSIFTGELDVKINTTRKNLTVFFSDIKSFTTITEKLEPEILTDLITNYLTEMTNIAIKHGGTVDKYIGDAIMIFFGDPNSNGAKKDATACVLMALEMKKKLKRLKRDWVKTGLSESLDVRMGIHTDVCTVGNFGSSDRLDYTVLGNGVNLASRLESLAKANQILISENTQNLIKNKIDCKFFNEVKVKGRAHPIKAYEVLGQISGKEDEAVIKVSRKGFELTLDKDEISNKEQVLEILEQSIDKLSS
tara:strand:- start:159 stop:1844 length:1686 start_codon:yes stop_codon:yes gene_type:complete